MLQRQSPLHPRDTDCAYPRIGGRHTRLDGQRGASRYGLSLPVLKDPPRQGSVGQAQKLISRRTHAISTQALHTVFILTSPVCRKMQAYTSANDTAAHTSIGNSKLAGDAQPETCCTAPLPQSHRKILMHHADLSTLPSCSRTACMALKGGAQSHSCMALCMHTYEGYQ